MKARNQNTLKQFDIKMENKIGALSGICDLLAKNAINIRSISANDLGVGSFITEDEESTRKIFEKAKMPFSVFDVLTVRVADRPGELGKIAKKLSMANVNINSIFLLEKDSKSKEVVLAVKVNNIEAAKKALL